MSDTYNEEAEDTFGRVYSKPDWKTKIEGQQLLKLMQGQSPAVIAEDAEQGKYYVDGIGELPSPVVAIPIEFAKTRSYSTDGNDEDFDILCHSNDMIHGFGEPGGMCDTCVLAQWENKTPPLCTEAHHFLMFIPSEEIFVEWVLRKAATKASALIKNLSAMRGLLQTPLELTSRRAPSKKGYSYWIPAVKRVANLTDDQKFGISMLKEFLGISSGKGPLLLPSGAEEESEVVEVSGDDVADVSSIFGEQR